MAKKYKVGKKYIWLQKSHSYTNASIYIDKKGNYYRRPHGTRNIKKII